MKVLANNCERCNIETQVLSMSWFNTQMICPRCGVIERAHPKFEEARSRERNEVENWNFNYEGIGLPNDLK